MIHYGHERCLIYFFFFPPYCVSSIFSVQSKPYVSSDHMGPFCWMVLWDCRCSLYNGCWDCISFSKVPCLSLSRSLSLPMCHLLLRPCSWAPTSWKLLFVWYFSWESESLRRGWVCSLALWRCFIRSLWRQHLAELLRERGNDCKRKQERARKVEKGEWINKVSKWSCCTCLTCHLAFVGLVTKKSITAEHYPFSVSVPIHLNGNGSLNTGCLTAAQITHTVQLL